MMYRSVFTVPNLLTAFRLGALVPVIMLFRHGFYEWAAGLFLFAMLTDAVDGTIASRLNQRSRFGLYLDPVTDKIVILSLFYELAGAGLLPFTAAHLMLARELLQNGVRAAAAGTGVVVGANWMGKLKAFLQTIAVCAGLLLRRVLGRVEMVHHGRILLVYFGFVFFLVGLSYLFTAIFIWKNRFHLLGDAKA